MSEASKPTSELQELSQMTGVPVDQLMAQCYDSLRRMARNQLHSERAGHTLNTTSLVHEVWLKLIGGKTSSVASEREFFAYAARMMRQILIDHARGKNRAKRGDGLINLTYTDSRKAALTIGDTADLIALDSALRGLEALDPRQAQVVELRYFAGLSIPEAARVLGISEATVKREWTMARAWLFHQLKTNPQAQAPKT